MTYLPSIFRIHTSSSSKNISGPSRFSMSLKPLQGTWGEDTDTHSWVTRMEESCCPAYKNPGARMPTTAHHSDVWLWSPGPYHSHHREQAAGRTTNNSPRLWWHLRINHISQTDNTLLQSRPISLKQSLVVLAFLILVHSKDFNVV